MIMYVNGREVEVPSNANGEVDVVDVRRMANVPNDRMLMRQTSAGENIILPTHGAIRTNPYEHFMESARGRRGL